MQTDEIKQTLYEVVCIFRGWHSDGTAWSEYDQSVLDKVLKLQKQFEGTVPTPSDEHIHAAAREFGESFKTGEWFENIRIEAYTRGALWVRGPTQQEKTVN